jgi:hypothetical protein
MLLEALAKELPSATIRYSSKVVSIEESSFYKIVHLADGTTYKTKVNSISFFLRERCHTLFLLCFLIYKKPNYLEPN